MPIRRGTWWTPGDNPLRRPVDRTQQRSVLALVLAAVLLVPGLGWLAGASTFHWNAGVERAEQAARQQVTARLLEDATLRASGRPYIVVTLAPAAWRGPDGSQHTGELTARPGAPAGTTQPLWTDAAGNPVDPPQTRGQTMVAVLVTVFLTVLAAGSLLACAGCLLVRRFDRQRYAMWDAAWARMDEQHPV